MDKAGLREAIEKSNLDNNFLVEGETDYDAFAGSKTDRKKLGGVSLDINNLQKRDLEKAVEEGGYVKALMIVDKHQKEVEKRVEEGLKVEKTNRKKLDEYTDYLVGVLEEDIKIRKERKAQKKS